MFLGIIAVVTTAFAAEFTQRQRAEGYALFLATSDPLTGLGNYRKLFENLATEIKRSDRLERSFAFLLLDLDSFEINDAHGHLVGDRALCRLAGILRSHIAVKSTRLPATAVTKFAVVIPKQG